MHPSSLTTGTDRSGPDPAPLSLAGDVVEVTGVALRATTLQAFTDSFVELARDAGGVPLRFVNAYSLALAADEPEYREVLTGPGISLPDSAPVGRIVRWKSRGAERRAGQVRGPSFFPAVLDQGRRSGLKHFLLGGTDESLKSLCAVIGTRYPGVEVAGTWAPPFGPVDDALVHEAAVRVAASGADVLWLSLGTPKQDFAAARLAPLVKIPVAAVGAAFDFESGAQGEAPGWMRRAGLEWVFRFASEPRRLWRRYVFGNLRFVVEVVRTELVLKRRATPVGPR